MDYFNCATFITNIALSITKALFGLFCAPAYDSFKATVEAILDPLSLDEDANKLEQFWRDINAMSDSDERNRWIKEAKETIDQIDHLRLLESGSSNHNDDHSSGCLCGDACSRCNLHRNIKKLIAQGEIIKRPVLGRKTIEHIDDVPNIGDGTTADRKLKEVMEALNDDNVRCIGVWGTGGVGKSTLVKALNNKLAVAKSGSPFSLVRLVDLAKNDKDDDVRTAIAKSLDLEVGEGIQDKIHNTLQKEKFLLILDNVWLESIQLSSIGIPIGQKGSKIVLTTRSYNVCTKMGAKPIDMGYLTELEAWKLFAEKAGEVVNNKEIKPLAEEVCKECGYLPLALVVVGSAMKGETSIDEWRNAVNNLQSSVPINADIELKVYKPLKLSYDSLNDTLKACFLYCSLHPVGNRISINELVQCWVAENLIDKRLYYSEAYGTGMCLIRKLKESCLLENVTKTTVKMHDVVRDVARWIGESIKKSVVFSRYGISFSPIVTLPEEVRNFRWISFVDNREIKLPEYEKEYSGVTTLLVDLSGNSKSIVVSTSFLKGFRAVKVLYLVDVESFDASHLQLEELNALIIRVRSNIEALPTAINLKILDISSSKIEIIPRGMKELSNLKVLNLSSTGLKTIDAETIRSLNLLEVLNMICSEYRWPIRKRSESDGATLEDLSGLRFLREVYLELDGVDGTCEECSWMATLRCFYFSYDKLSKNTRRSKDNAFGGFKGKIFHIKMYRENTKVEVGSFILHAEKVKIYRCRYGEKISRLFHLSGLFGESFGEAMTISSGSTSGKYNVLWDFDEVITISSRSTSGKYNALWDFDEVIKISSGSTSGRYNVVWDRPNRSVCRWESFHRLNLAFLNVEELSMRSTLVISGFSKLASAIGANFSTLKILYLSSVGCVFSSDDLHMVLPELERISVDRCEREVLFNCGPAEIQVIAPKLRMLVVENSDDLERLCSFESNEQWLSLEILQVTRCPKLKKLPKMPTIKEIRGEPDWWNQVEWDKEETKLYMNQRFMPIDPPEINSLQPSYSGS